MKYAELWCKTNFSFLEGASHSEELASRAAELGYHALAITDRNSLAGVVRAHAAAKKAKLKLLVGAEIHLIDGPPLLLHAMNLTGYRNLSQMITRGRRNAEKGQCNLTVADIGDFAGDLLAVTLPGATHVANASGSDVNGTHVADASGSDVNAYRDIFAERIYYAAAVHLGPDDDAVLDRHADTARRLRIPLLASNCVHYHVPARRALHEVLTAVRHHTRVSQLGALRFPNGERYLKSPVQMADRFTRHHDAMARTVEAADRCHFSLDELRYQYPEELCPAGKTPSEHLAKLTWAGAQTRYPHGIPDKVRQLIERELKLIAELKYEAFFLTVWDLVVFARGRGILCQGRGSAANSAVCYCLGITSVDPDRADLLFERFISKERDEAPDIDVDFEHERREEVLQYVYQKYGRERAGIVAEVITYQPRSAVRDVGKVLGLSLDAVDRLAKAIDWSADPSIIQERLHEAGLDARAPAVAQLVQLTSELVGFPRHLSQHVGGFVITDRPLSEMVPIENAAMPDRTVIQWDKNDIDELGILKVDCLSLGMLTAIRKCLDLIGRHHGVAMSLAEVPAEDPKVYDMICKADTIGVFQIESRAQMSMLPRLKPRCFYDLVIEVAIVRPGPIQGGMVHPFLRRRSGKEPVTYPHPVVEQVLAKTLGVPLFQEQVMRLAIVAAGFTPGEADQLRRAMGAWRRSGVIEKFRDKFRDGLIARGFPEAFADQIYEQIRGFGEYGFPESHAASFALLAYISAWLKCHYPCAFAAAIINSQPMGFYSPAQLVQDARAHGVVVRPIDINRSDWDCTLENAAASPAREGGEISLRLGFRIIRGLPEAQAQTLMAARENGPFHSPADVLKRTSVAPATLARLAAADAFASLGLNRREALWQALTPREEPSLFSELDQEQALPQFPEMVLSQHVSADYEATGLSLKAHPIELVRDDLNRLGVTAADCLDALNDQITVRVAGLVLVRQRPPTANGTVFMTLEDETGLINLIIWNRTWERHRVMAKQAVGLIVEGKVERADGVIHVCPNRMEDLSRALWGITTKSRDFR